MTTVSSQLTDVQRQLLADRQRQRKLTELARLGAELAARLAERRRARKRSR
jgi:hypothetical protein